MKRAVVIVLIMGAALAGCVLMRDNSTYNRYNSVEQSGSNRVTKLDLDVTP